MQSKLILLLTFLSFNLFAQTDLAKPFADCNVEGSITIYDYNTKKWISSNTDDSHFATLPASTFKVVNTLIALEHGIAEDENHVVKWPGKTDELKYGHRPEIYHDITVKEAFKVSAGWAYREMAKVIGKDYYRKKLSEINYGNVDLSIEDADFWNFGDFAISPVNQIEILIRVYEETLPFKKESFAILKEIMIEESTEDYVLRAKTGWTRVNGKDLGWWIGYVTQDDNVYFFATRISKDLETPNDKFAYCRKQITKQVFRQMGVMEWKP